MDWPWGIILYHNLSTLNEILNQIKVKITRIYSCHVLSYLCSSQLKMEGSMVQERS